MRKICLIVAIIVMMSGVCFADEARLDKLYAEYGKLQVQAEIIQNQTMQVKKAIAEELNKPVAQKEEPKKE